MKQIIKYINDNVLFKVASLNTVSVLTRIITGFLTSKAIALFIGAEGLALIGNLRNFLSSAQAISILGFYNGAVKYIAEFKENLVELSKTISTLFYLGLASTILVSLFCYFNAEAINVYIFSKENDYAYVIRILACVLPLYAANMFIFSIMNGFSKYKILIIINIIGQVLCLCITLLLMYQEQLDGALISVVIAESIIFLITFVAILNRRSLISLIKIKNVNIGIIKNLSAYSMMSLFTIILLPLVTIYIRTYIINTIGEKEAGFWEAMTRISRYYLLFITSLLTLYILPRFSEIDSKIEFRKEVFNFYKTIIPIFGLGLLVIYFLRQYIVQIIFCDDFKPVQDLFFWQLLGDFAKVLSIVISYQFLAKKMLWYYILTEVFSISVLYFASIYFIDNYGIKGATIAHFVNYVLYYIVILLIFGKALFGKLQE